MIMIIIVLSLDYFWGQFNVVLSQFRFNENSNHLCLSFISIIQCVSKSVKHTHIYVFDGSKAAKDYHVYTSTRYILFSLVNSIFKIATNLATYASVTFAPVAGREVGIG